MRKLVKGNELESIPKKGNLMKSIQVAMVVWMMVLASGEWKIVHAQNAQATDEGIEWFETKIRPVLSRECYGCHSQSVGVSRGGLRVDSKIDLLLGGDSGPALVPGSPEESLLLEALHHESFAMPPGQKLPDRILDDFERWIEMGAPYPDETITNRVQSTVSEEVIEQGKSFWSFNPPQRPTVPPTQQPDWALDPIDHFVLSKLEEKSLTPAPDADPNELLRRLCFDLVGLPPTPEQVSWFLEEWQRNPDDAVAKAADALLASEHFGERWARHWLDVARYAESSGKELNATFPHAWRYRDYVIDSFNEDKPYDRFVQEQIAGDLLPVEDDQQWAENLVATGFLALGPKTLIERNPRQFEADLIDEQIDTTTRVMLGVSVACARCHDHKFDPIAQEDYYALAGIFKSTETYYGTFGARQNRQASNLILLPIDDPSWFETPLSPQDQQVLENELARITAEAEVLRDEVREARSSQDSNGGDARKKIRELRQLQTRRAALTTVADSFHKDGSPKSFCMGTQPAKEPEDARLLLRGEIDQPAQQIPRGFVRVLGEPTAPIATDSSGRLEFARWMTDSDNPLLARVMVNRIWQHLIGRALVVTTENFGATGQPPSHPQLLDHLAISFMEQGWSTKRLIKQIVCSRTYRMSSRFDAASYEKDPENEWLWRAHATRLEAEALRDAILAVSGQLQTNRPRASLVAQGGEAVVRQGRLRGTRQLVLDNLLEELGDEQANMMMDTSMSDNDNNNSRAGKKSKGKKKRDRAKRKGNRQKKSSRRRQPGIDVINPALNCRSIYLPIVRDQIPRSLQVFDFAESTMVVGVRETSNTPDQGLYFLNNPFVIEQSEAMARRIQDTVRGKTAQWKLAFQLAYGRSPREDELKAARTFYRRFRPDGDDAELEKLAALCQAILASAEFRIVD